MSVPAVSQNQDQMRRKPRIEQEAAPQDPKAVRLARKQAGSAAAPLMLLEVALTSKQVAQAKRSAVSLRDLVVTKRSEKVNVERRILVRILDVLSQAQAYEAPQVRRGARVVFQSKVVLQPKAAMQHKDREISPQDAAKS